MQLTLESGGTPFALDLGPLTDEDDGDLSMYGGNLYVHIDGVEVGSLWFHRDDDGQVIVTFGSFDPASGQWVPGNNLAPQPVDI